MNSHHRDPRISLFDAPRISPPNRRGRPFQKGNPGRPAGARNKLTLMREALRDSNRAPLVVELARAGNRTAMVACLERLLAPPAPDRPVDVDNVRTAADAANAMTQVIQMISHGRLTPSDGEKIVRRIARVVRAQRKMHLARAQAAVAGNPAADTASPEHPSPEPASPRAAGIEAAARATDAAPNRPAAGTHQ